MKIAIITISTLLIIWVIMQYVPMHGFIIAFKTGEKTDNYAQKLIENEEYDENVIVGIMNVLIDKYYKENKPLSEAEKTIFLIANYEGEINNGGFDQFFFNGGNINLFDGDFAQLTVEALEKINAVKNVQIMKTAIDTVDNTEYGANSKKESDRLNELDNEFYEYPEDLAQLQLEYIKANINSFTR